MNEEYLSSARPRPDARPIHLRLSSTDTTEASKHFSGWHFFHCLDINVGIEYASKQSIINLDSGCIVLFNQTFDKDSALIAYNNVLFKMARQYLILIDQGVESSHYTTSVHKSTFNCDSLSNSGNNANYLVNSRLYICEFLAYVCNYFERLRIDYDFITNPTGTRITDKLLTNVSENMLSLQLLLENLGDILSVPGCTSSYHKLHAFLDIYCYNLDLLMCMDGLKTNVYFEGTNVSCQAEKHVNLFISKLLLLAIDKYHNMSFSDLVTDSPFSCVCMKQVWVMLIRLLDTLHANNDQKKSFWIVVNSLLQKVTSEAVSDKTSSSDELLPVPDNFLCQTPEMFKIWIVSHLAKLYEEEHLPIKDNFIQIESVIKQCIAPDSPISEIQLKSIILLITPLVSGIWVPKSDVIMIMWEYFHRRLNSMFLEQNASVDSIQAIKKSSACMIEEVKQCLDENFHDGDSWSLFLHLLGLYLKKCQQKHWHQVRGRIYSKFSPTKLQALTELGLYRLSSLFLVLCLSVDMKEASIKLLELLEVMKPTDSLRCHVLWRSHLALILLYMEHDLDIADISLPLRKKLNSISETKNNISLSMIRALVQEFESIIECDAFLKLSGSTLIDAWIPLYLSSCSETDAGQLYGVILSLILKVQGVWKENFPVQASMLADSLWRHILPCILVSTNNTKSCESESVLGYHLTLLALQIPGPSRSFISIFCRFMNSPSINVNVLGKYICLLNTDPVAMKALERMENYQGLIVRSWLKWLILSVDGTSLNTSSLTRLVSVLPEIVELAASQQINLCEESDTLAAFLKIVSSASSLFNDRISFYFSSQVETCLTKTSITSDALAIRLYKCAATFLKYAPNIIYNKVTSNSKTSNLLNAIMNQLLLPASVYNADTRLSTSVKIAITETIHLFIQGLAHLAPRSDAYIFKCLKDIIIQYLPRLVNSQPNTMQNFLGLEPETHPLLRCFDNLQSIQSEETGRLVLEVLSATCIACKGKTRHNYTTLALAIVKEVLRKWIGHSEIIQLVTDCALGNVLEVVMFTEGTTNVAHCKGIEILQMLLNQTGDIRSNQAKVLVNITKEHLAFSAVYVFRLLECIVNLDPSLVKASLPQVQDLVTIVERKRGVSFDRGLRSGIEKINTLLNLRCS